MKNNLANLYDTIQNTARYTHQNKYNVHLKLEGFECRGYPKIKITTDNQTNHHDAQVCGLTDIRFVIKNTSPKFDIKIRQHGKTNRNVMFDGEQILKNQYCVIKDIVINGVSMKYDQDIFWSHSTFEKDDGEIIPNTDGLYHNGEWRMTLPNPLFPFLNQRFQEKSGNKFRPAEIDPDHYKTIFELLF